MSKEYEVKAITTSIKFTSRASMKIRDNYYTVEACEERVIPDLEDVDIEQERKALWETVDEQCDNEIAEIVKAIKKREREKNNS